jgi:hypothetical protein
VNEILVKKILEKFLGKNWNYFPHSNGWVYLLLKEIMCYTKEQIEEAVKSKGYVWFNSAKDYDVNIVGIRNSSKGNKVTNVFDDCLTISYKQNGEWKSHCWAATTEPGKKGMQKGKARGGVAILVPGQYRGVYAISKHQGKYDAVCQRLGNVTVWRDPNKDLIFDTTKTDTGMFGINIHKAGVDSTWVENWSEGCQVFKRVKDFNEFMSICKAARKSGWDNKFTYTLLDSKDIK